MYVCIEFTFLCVLPSYADLTCRMLKELSLSKCPALKQLPSTGRSTCCLLRCCLNDVRMYVCMHLCKHFSAANMSSLRELDLRAAKKQVCKITPEMVRC